MKNAFKHDDNKNWNKDKWEKKDSNSLNEQNPAKKETSSQESSTGKYVREENDAKYTNNNKR